MIDGGRWIVAPAAAAAALARSASALVTYVPDAVQHGVQLVHNCHVDRVRFTPPGPARATRIVGAAVGRPQ